MSATVTASYEIEGMIGNDPRIDALMKHAAGQECSSSGSGFGKRDMQWTFDDYFTARDAAWSLELIKGVTVLWEDSEEDEEEDDDD